MSGGPGPRRWPQPDAGRPPPAARSRATRPRHPARHLGYLAVLAVAGAGLAVTWMHHFRYGATLLAAALVLAAVLRAVLPTHDAGLLAVRRRSVDVVGYLMFGVALLVLARLVPG